MTVDANDLAQPNRGASLKTQTTLNRFFQRYQVTSNVDSVALLRSRALQEAQRRNLSPQSEPLNETAAPDLTAQLQHPTNEEMQGSLAASATPNPSRNSLQMIHDPTKASMPGTESPASGGSTENDISQQQDLKRKQPGSNHSDAVLKSMPDDTPRPAKRSRSTSVEPGPRQPTPTSSTSLSEPPHTSQLSIPSSLRSLSVVLSQDRPPYVPSSQSDEDPESQGDIPVRAEEATNNYNIEDASDADSESSLSSLDDLSDILQPYNGRAPRETRTRSSYYRTKQSALNTSQKPQFTGKYSLSNLVRQHNQDLSAEAQVSRAQSVLNDSGQDGEAHQDVSAGVDKSLLSSVVNQDDREDEVHKLLHAMSRADVLNTEIAWHFFNYNGSGEGEQLKINKFPKLRGDLARYQTLFADPQSRKSAFLTGFAREIVSALSVPDELRDWLWNAAALEPDDALAEAYMSTLASPKSMNLIDSDHVSTLFQHLGAKPSSTNLANDITPSQESVNAPRRQPPKRLPRILRMLTRLPHCISTTGKTYTVAILLRLAVDVEIAQEVSVRSALHKSLEALISLLPADAVDDSLFTISNDLLKLTHPILQDRLLSSIPSTTPRLHLFKRRLALAFFLSSPTPLQTNLTDATASTTLARALITRLKTDPFLHTPDSTADYRALAASISILDVAIDAGFAPRKARDAEASTKQHDKTIDALIAHVHVLFARIVDSGASHLARTEAKAVLERVLYRLDFGVRSVPREARGALVGAATRTMPDYFVVNQKAVRGNEGQPGDVKGEGKGNDEDDDAEDDAYVTASEDNDDNGAGAARVSRFLAHKRAIVAPGGGLDDDDDNDDDDHDDN